MKPHTLIDIFSELKNQKGFFIILDPDRRNVWLEPDNFHKKHLEDLVGAKDFFTSILIGGSTGVTKKLMDETIDKLVDKGYPKERIGILLSHHTTFTENASYVVLPECLNATNKYYAHKTNSFSEFYYLSKDIMSNTNIKCVSTAYLLVMPADETTVGKVLKPEIIENYDGLLPYMELIKRRRIKTLSLEAGSGAYKPVDIEIIRACRDNFEGTITVGGGIKTPYQSKQIFDAGADVIIIGDAIEKAKNPGELIKTIYQSI